MWVGRLLARLSPRDSVPESLRTVSPFLDSDPLLLAKAADSVGIGFVCVLSAMGVLVGRPSLLLVAVGAGYGATVAVRGAAVAVANARQSRALGAAPALVSRAVLRTRIEPTAEAAADFAAGSGGRLGDRLAEHVRRARGTPRSGLGTFADAWREVFPALHRSVTLVAAAAAAPPGERDRALDRAMDAILDGTRTRAVDAAESLRGPATAIYAFGVLLPLALVSVVPAAGAAGVAATLPAIVVIYDLVLPVGLLCAGGWLLANRPVVFPPASIDSARKRHRAVPLAVGGVAGTCGWLLAGLMVPSWTRPLAALGIGVGTALISHYRPIVTVRKRADELDAALPDALYLVGRRVADGVAVERAVAETATELDGVAGTAFESAARRQRHLRVGVETAFNGEHGAFESMPSRRAESVGRLLGVAAESGPPAGRALIETADHLDSLRRVEEEARRDLGRVTATLGNTAAFFAPLVGGATVALADNVGTVSTLGGSAPETAGLGTAIGVYVLLLAAILTVLSTGLSRGLDRATVGYRTGAALCAATATYLVAFAATGMAAGGL
ncbi:MAG: hypothetical protein ACI8UR_000405 [Natronomonas sp.]|jgi:hypothetical protein|uniref:type II secretion system F family protein n=1 Tax=Natronomonas sp. TaxID=2184060 RepID=UPI003988DECE